MAGNQTCQLCYTEQAEVFCKCTVPSILLCRLCSATHQAKSPGIPHLTLPVAASDRDEEQFLNRFQRLRDGKAAIFNNLVSLQRCRDEVNSTIDSAIVYLNQHRDWVLQCLQKEEEEISSAVNTAVVEAENCVAQGSEPENPLAKAILMLAPQELCVFTYSIAVLDLQSLCETLVTHHNTLQDLCKVPVKALEPAPVLPLVAAVDPSQLLVCVESHQLKFFSVTTRSWERAPLKTPIPTYEGCRYVWVETHLFCSGGYGRDGKCRGEAMLLKDGKEWESLKLGDLRIPRFAHGLWWLSSRRFVLVFGGNKHIGTGNFQF
jgi:hypothetical protein